MAGRCNLCWFVTQGRKVNPENREEQTGAGNEYGKRKKLACRQSFPFIN